MVANGLVRHGHLPEREIMTGIGAVAVRYLPARRHRSRRVDAGRLVGGGGRELAENAGIKYL
jgi:hypothetical protein